MGLAAVLALATSLAYGLSNYIGPRLARGAPLFVLLIAGQTCALILSGVIVVATGDAAPGAAALGFAALAGLGNAAGLILFYKAAQAGPLSIVVPIGSMGALIPVAVGLLSGEELRVLEGVGIVLALTGLFFAARRTLPEGEVHDYDRRRTILLSAAATVFFGVFLAAIAPASEESAGWAVLGSRVTLVIALVVVGAMLGELERVALGRLPALTVPGLLLFAGTISYSIATREGDLSVVSVLGTLFPIVTVSLAVALDGERLSRSQALGVAGSIVGIVLLSAR